MSKRYLLIHWSDYKEKNNQKVGDSGDYDQLVEEGMDIQLIGINAKSFVKELKEDEITVSISGKGEYTVKLGESFKISYTDGYQVCGDWVDLYTSFEIKYSEKSLKEIRDALPEYEIENNVLIKGHTKNYKITIPEGIIEIGYCAFNDSYISEVKFPSTLKKIGMCAFHNCKNIKEIDIPEGVESIDSFAFSYTSLENAKLPSTLKRINTYAFSGTKFLEKYEHDEFVILGNGLLYLYNGHDEEVIIPEGVKSICPLAFSQNDKYCTSLTNYFIKKIVLPKSLETICDAAFFRLNSLKEINLNSKIDIDKTAFKESVYEEKFLEFLNKNGK